MQSVWIWAAPLVLTIVGIDQLTKWLVLEEPVFRAIACLDRSVACGRIEMSGVFDLSMTWNRGVSFGALQAEGLARWALFAVTLAIAAGFSVWLHRSARLMTSLALALVIGGAAGNLIDRARFGAVVDFLDFSGLYFPWVFNVADACISCGAALLLLDQMLAGRKTSG
jgi:signal peptidase II